MPSGPSGISMYAEITQVKTQNINNIQQSDKYHICTLMKSTGTFSSIVS